MKNFKLLFIGFMAVLTVSCSKDDASETAKFAVPTIKSLETIRNSVLVTSAKQTNSDGKIYVANDKLFYIAKEHGIHVFDNQNPSNPQNIIFITIEGVHDIAIKGNYLYADNYVDLLVFDISDLQDIKLIKKLENVIEFNPTYPEDVEFYDYNVLPNEGEIITGFTIENRKKPTNYNIDLANDVLTGFEASNGSNAIGTGGSYAKFQINNNALYTLDSYKLNIFNITEPINTNYVNSIYLELWIGGGVFETLFKQKEYLFVGSTNGMYIINAFNEFSPYFVSGFSHATACDPVVVHENTAYITVRGGSNCGAIEDQVNVIDFTNVETPTLISSYNLNQPYGLGVRDTILYVCCGDDGLKIFDASNSSNLVLENTINNNVKDVIPLSDKLITVGNNTITQYSYGENFTLNVLSVLNF